MKKDTTTRLQNIMAMPIDAYQHNDGSIILHYPENIDINKSEYYTNRVFLIDFIKIKRTINDFLAGSLQKDKLDTKFINIVSNFAFQHYFYLTTPMLDKTFIDLYLPDEIPGANDCKLDDNNLAHLLQDVCLKHLSDRIQALYGTIPVGILYGEFLRIVDATIDHFSCNSTMHIQKFMDMFLEPPKLMSEQWNPNYCSAICIYPWRAFELVCRLEDFMRAKKDKEAMLYVHAAIEAGVVFREWKRFEIQYGAKYCSRKTYDKYTDRTQKYRYYTQEELDPLISFFMNYKPTWEGE